MARRKHHKIKTFPPEVVDAVNARLAEGHTYEDVADWLTQMGHPIGKSSVGRYAKDWTGITERVKEAQAQAQVLVQDLRERPNSDLAEASEQMILTLVSNALATGQIEIKKGDPIKMGHMLADLQRAGVQREKLKLTFHKTFEEKAEQASENVKKLAVKAGIDEATIRKIEEEVLGIVRT